jgi:O-antigen/teichoic acid export membrane protein
VIEEIRRLFKHTAIYGLGNVLNKAVGFVLIPFYTHYLTPGDYGTLELLDLSTALVGLLLNIWMNASVVRYYHDYDDRKNRREVVSTALVATSVVAACVSSAGLFCAKGVSRLVLKSPAFYSYVWLVSFTLFFSCLNSVSWSYLRARQRSALIVIANCVSLVMTLTLNIYFIAVLKTGLVGILYSGLISNALVTTGLTVMTVKEVGLGFNFAKLKALAVFGLPLIVTSAAAFVLNFSDRFFLQRYSTISTVGIYALGYKFGFMLSFLVIQPFMMIWGARMYEVARRGDAGETFSRLFAYFFLVLTAAALGLSVAIKDVIAVIAAPQFHEAYRIVPVVALAYLCYGMSYYFQTGIFVQKRTMYLAIIGLASAGANLLLNFLLIPHYGAMGAAWATVLSFLLMAVLTYISSQSVYRIPYSLSRMVLPAAAAIVIYLASTLFTIHSWIVDLGLKLLFIPLFGITMLVLGFFDESEVSKLRQSVQQAWGECTFWGVADISRR